MLIGICAVTLVVVLAALLAILLKGGNTPPSPGTVATNPSQTSSQTSSSSQGSTTTEGGYTGTTQSTPPVITTSSTAPVAGSRRPGVYTFLVVGLDQQKYLTDAILLATFDTVNGTLNCMSIPRDTYSMAGGRPKGQANINQAYARGGIEQLKFEVQNLVGFSPDYHVIVEMDAFVKIVNYLGGVEYNVPFDMDMDDPTQDLYIHISKGLQLLDGENALKVIRYRHNISDLARISVRHGFLKEAVRTLLQPANVRRAAEIAGVTFDNIRTSMSRSDIIYYAQKAVTMDMDNVHFYTLSGTYSQYIGSPYWIPNEQGILKQVNDHFNPLTVDIVTINVGTDASEHQ